MSVASFLSKAVGTARPLHTILIQLDIAENSGHLFGNGGRLKHAHLNPMRCPVFYILYLRGVTECTGRGIFCVMDLEYLFWVRMFFAVSCLNLLDVVSSDKE